MMDQLWGSFPRLLEQNINGLLESAQPSPTKAFQIYKACKNDDLWRENFDQFSKVLEAFYSKPKHQRRKSQFDQYLDRPMDSDIFLGMHLNFRTAQIEERSVNDLASWAHNVIRIGRKTLSSVISHDVMTKTLRAITQPGPFDKAENIEFEDFCSVWKKTVTKMFGSAEDREFQSIVTELRKINQEHTEIEELSGLIRLPLIQITPIELDWIKMVRLASLAQSKIPKPPVVPGVRKQALKELDRVIQLYEMVLVTDLPELQKHRASTRLTLIDRCDTLIADAEPRAA